MADGQNVDERGQELSKEDQNETMNEIESTRTDSNDVGKEQATSKPVSLRLADDVPDSPIFSDEDKEDDDLVLFDLQRPLDSDREGR